MCDSVISLVFSLGRDHCSDVCISGRKNLSGTSICIYLSAEHLCSSFESLLVFLDVTLFSNIRLSDLNMLLWPVYLYPYYHYANRTNRLCAIFYSFFTYLAVEGTATFLTIIVSSVLGDALVAAYSIVYNMCIRLVSLGIIWS